jgi:hypothetical protein
MILPSILFIPLRLLSLFAAYPLLHGFAQGLLTGVLHVVVAGQTRGRVAGRLAPAFEELTVEMMGFAADQVAANAVAEKFGDGKRCHGTCDWFGHSRRYGKSSGRERRAEKGRRAKAELELDK